MSDRLRAVADWLDKERRFRWPKWAPWRRRVMMRWAVREHRRIHDSGSTYLMNPCKMRLMLSRTNRMMRSAWSNSFSNALDGAMNNTIQFRRFERITSETRELP